MAFTIIESCTGCTACAKRCPTAAIHGMRKQLFYIDSELCIDCGACGIVCPDEAILDSFGQLCVQLKAKERPKAFVEFEQCVGCVYCVNSCPFDCISMQSAPAELAGGGLAATVAVVDLKKCTGCTVCERECPYDAIHVWRQSDPQAQENLAHQRRLFEGDRLPFVKEKAAQSGHR